MTTPPTRRRSTATGVRRQLHHAQHPDDDGVRATSTRSRGSTARSSCRRWRSGGWSRRRTRSSVQVNQFIDFNGRSIRTTALTTGYDFLADGANEIADALDGVVGAANTQRLINETWTSADLTAAFNDATPVPDIASINAHFDHYRLLPGAGNTTNDESDLYTTDRDRGAANGPPHRAGGA